jgi:hypothetical protein
MIDSMDMAGMGAAPQQPEQSKQAVPRERPEVDKGRADLVKEWCDRVTEAKEHWSPKFDAMRKNQTYAHGRQAVNDDGTKSHDSQAYQANLVLRRINQRVAAIYAKNPRAAAKRRPRMDFQVWDGTVESLQMAQQTIQQAQVVKQAMAMGGGSPMLLPGQAELMQAAQLLADVKQGAQRRKMLDRLGKTLEIIFHWSLDEPLPRFKTQAKQLVRRTLTTGIGYVKLGYQRVMTHSPDAAARIKDLTDRLARIERMSADLSDGETLPESAEAERLRIELTELQSQKDVVVREGLTFDFPKSWQVIPCIDTVQLKGFIGATFVAHEFLLTKKKIQEVYGVDIGSAYSGYKPTGQRGDKRKRTDQLACVWEIYDLEGRIMYTVCDGYPDFLKEPGRPAVDLEQFHPFFTVAFNDVEDDEDIFPPSDVELLLPMANEYNRSREGLRQHRIANRPAWVSAKGTFGDDSKTKLADHESHEMIDLNISSGKKIEEVLQAKPTQKVDPGLYDVEHLFTDILRVSGDSEPNFGGTSGATATETTIAEQSRASGLQSNIDDLDELFTELARASGQVLLTEMSAATAKRIAGDGAVWPTLDRRAIAEELYLDIKAGSSGRPNSALKIAKLEKIGPLVIQTPGLNPTWWLRQLLTELDDTVEIEDGITEGLPSMTAMNSMTQPGTGDPANDPNQQGARGRQNAPQAPGSESGGGQMFPGGAPAQPAQPAV